jgi:hypothetical protein
MMRFFAACSCDRCPEQYGGATDARGGWGAVLRAMRVVTAARLRDDEPARPMSAVRVAQHWLRSMAREELWWVRKRNRWVRDGGRDARRAPKTLAEWAMKWSGLFRLRDERRCPSGYDANGWAMTTWPVRDDGG